MLNNRHIVLLFNVPIAQMKYLVYLYIIKFTNKKTTL